MKRSFVYYMGKRLNGEKLSQAFLTEKDEVVLFSGIKSVYIGHAYEWDAKKRTIKLGPERLKDEIHEDANRWWDEERGDIQEYKTIRDFKKFEKYSDLKPLIEVLARRTKGMFYSELRTLVEFLVNEAMKEKRK